MAKQTDITGTFRVPQEAWGSFWNFMLTCPGAEITPNTRAQSNGSAPAKRTKGSVGKGSTGKCIMLTALADKGRPPMTTAQLTQVIVDAGKQKSSAANMIYELRNEKLIKGDNKTGYSITSAGAKFCATHCNVS
jgi:hypothetical protein